MLFSNENSTFSNIFGIFALSCASLWEIFGEVWIDEAPFAYRGLEEIREAVQDTLTIEDVLKPVCNFKADGTDWAASSIFIVSQL